MTVELMFVSFRPKRSIGREQQNPGHEETSQPRLPDDSTAMLPDKIGDDSTNVAGDHAAEERQSNLVTMESNENTIAHFPEEIVSSEDAVSRIPL